MKRIFQRKWAYALAILAATLTGAWAIGAAKDSYEVVKMTETPQTVCVGRMLIDLPQEAQYRLFGASVDNFDISTSVETPDAFSTMLAQREAEIRATPDEQGGNKNLEYVGDTTTASGLTGKIFMHGRTVTEGTRLNKMKREHYRYVDVVLEAHMHGNGVSIRVSGKDFAPEAIDDLTRLVHRLVANPANRLPTEPGFCLDQAYVIDPPVVDQNERIVLAAGLPSRPDITLWFSTMSGHKPHHTGLVARNAASHARAPLAINLRFTNLRAGPRTIGGLTGDELVEQVLEENFSIIYGFEWEVLGAQDDVFVPGVTLRMKTGHGADGPVPSSLSQPAAVALWDRISSSIRLRPTGVPVKKG